MNSSIFVDVIIVNFEICSSSEICSRKRDLFLICGTFDVSLSLLRLFFFGQDVCPLIEAAVKVRIFVELVQYGVVFKEDEDWSEGIGLINFPDAINNSRIQLTLSNPNESLFLLFVNAKR
jgi:hypothetical protein